MILDELGFAPIETTKPDASVSGEEIAKRILNFLIFNYIETIRGVNEGLELFGLLDREEFNIDSEDPANPEYEIATYRFDRVGDWFSTFHQDKFYNICENLLFMFILFTFRNEYLVSSTGEFHCSTKI